MDHYKQLISALYVAIYGRAPDNSGLRYWTGAMEQGQPYQQIANGFMQHPLYNHFYGSLDYKGLVNAFYQNILGGAGDTGGIDYWVGRLNQGETAAEVLSSFLEASINIDLSQQGSLSYSEWQSALNRQNTLKNKADAGIFYAEHLGDASEMQGNIDSLAVQNEASYIAARDILFGINADRASYEQTKTYIQENYQYQSPVIDEAAWENWFTQFIAQLTSGQWDGDYNSIGGLDGVDFDRLFNGLEDGDDDFSWLFGGANANGEGWGWFSAYIELIMSWLGQSQNIWGGMFDGTGNGYDSGYGFNFEDLFGDLGNIYGKSGFIAAEDLEQIELIGQNTGGLTVDEGFLL